MECQMRDVFYAVYLSGTMLSLRITVKNAAFGGNASPQPADASIAHFLEDPTATCPRSAGQKCSQFCGMCKSWILNELCLELVPKKKAIG